VIAILVVLAAVVLVAAGRGGEMPAVERSDYAPIDMGPVSATDVVLLRPPTALWGYNQQATDEALDRIAESIRERDVRIVALEQMVTDLSRRPGAPMPLGSPHEGAQHARLGGGPGWRAQVMEALQPAYDVPPAYDAPLSYEAQRASSDDAQLTRDMAADPLAAPVREPEQDVLPWQSGTDWPPEASRG
jgi:hypothetical protein